MKIVGCLLALLCYVVASPVSDDDGDYVIEHDKWNDWVNFGDVLIRKEDVVVTRAGITGRQGSTSNFLWPNNTLYFRIHRSLIRKQRKRVVEAMKEIESAVPGCFKFKQWRHGRDAPHYIRVGSDKPKGGCNSAVGYTRSPRKSRKTITNQRLQLSKGCRYGSLVHELLHATGFNHEQSRDDRDNYVQIMFDNIKKGHEHNFIKSGDHGMNTSYYKVPYNIDSMMHYHWNEFAVDKSQATIVVIGKQGSFWGKEENMGQRKFFSRGDLLMIARRGGCPEPTDKEKNLKYDEPGYEDEDGEEPMEGEDAEEDDANYDDEDIFEDYEDYEAKTDEKGTILRLNFNFKNAGK